jgi:hypothetical protein
MSKPEPIDWAAREEWYRKLMEKLLGADWRKDIPTTLVRVELPLKLPEEQLSQA